MILPEIADPPRYYRLHLPLHATGGWLNINDRHLWYTRRRLTQHWRQLGCLMARKEKIPALPDGGYLVGELRFADGRKRDAHNWQPTAKAALDGLVDAGVFPDDNNDLVVGPDMRCGAVVKRGQQALIMHIWPREYTVAGPEGIGVSGPGEPLQVARVRGGAS